MSAKRFFDAINATSAVHLELTDLQCSNKCKFLVTLSIDFEETQHG